MYTKMPYLKRRLRNFAFWLFNKIENNNNTIFEENGEEFFIKNLFKSMREMGGDMIVFDIGANVGNYSSMLLHYAKIYNINLKIHLFEPTKGCFTVLSEKFRNKNNIILNNFGLSNNNTIAKIFYDEEQSGLASLYQRNLEHYGIKLTQSEDIILKRADEYISEYSINHIDFIKLDVEGHELKVLEGFGDYLNGDFIDYIQFEYGGAYIDSRSNLMEIYNFLTKRNFTIAKIMPSGLEIRDYKPFMDNFQYANYVAISNRRVL